MNGLFADSDLDHAAPRISLRRVVRMPRTERVGIRGFTRHSWSEGTKPLAPAFPNRGYLMRRTSAASLIAAFAISGTASAQIPSSDLDKYLPHEIHPDMFRRCVPNAAEPGCVGCTGVSCNSCLDECDRDECWPPDECECDIECICEGGGAEVNSLDVSDPVDLSTGSFRHSETDIEVSSAGGGVSFSRTYRSQDGYDDRSFFRNNDPGFPVLPDPRFRFGRNWSHSLNIFLTRTPNALVFHNGTTKPQFFREFTVVSGYRLYERFLLPGTVLKVKDAGLSSVTEPVTLTLPEGTVYTFKLAPSGPQDPWPTAANGKVWTITEKNGLTTTFSYDAGGDVSRVEYSTGARLDFAYANWTLNHVSGPSVVKLLASVTEMIDHDGPGAGQQPVAYRSVSYDYYTNWQPGDGGNPGDLKTVTITPPPGEGSPRTHLYKYAEDGVMPHQTNLTDIYNPRGELVLKNIYTTHAYPVPIPANPSPAVRLQVASYDAVVTQLRDEPSTASVERYDYVYLPAGSGTDLNEMDAGVSINRSGHVKTLHYKGSTVKFRTDFTGTVADRQAFVSMVTAAWSGAAELGKWTAVEAAVKANLAPTRARPTDPPGYREKHQHDDAIKNTSIKYFALSAGNDVAASETVRTYDGNGSMLSEKTVLGSDVTKDEWTYDTGTSCACAARPLTHSAGNGAEISKFGYDQWGNRIAALYGCSSANYAIKNDGIAVERWEYDPARPWQLLKHWPRASQNGEFTAGTATSWPEPTFTAGRISYSYYPDNDASYRRGRVSQMTVQINGTPVTTQYDYDEYGNVAVIIDPLGTATYRDYNAFGEMVSEEVRSGTIGLPVLSRRTVSYDLGGNPVREDREIYSHVGTPGAAALLDVISTVRDFDRYGRMTRESREESPFALASNQVSTLAPTDLGALAQFVTTEYVYHANDQLAEYRSGMAVGSPAKQPLNIVRYEYDERDRLFKQIEAPGSIAESVTRYDYDADGNLVKRYDGFCGGCPDEALTTYVYAAKGVIDRVIDPTNVVTDFTVDLAGRTTKIERGPTAGASFTVMARSEYVYDGLGRQTSEKRWTSISPAAFVTRTTEYWPSDAVKAQVDERGKITSYQYDTAGRMTQVASPDGSTSQLTLDALGRATATSRTEVSSVNPASVQTFTATATYDELDGVIAETDGRGNATVYVRDSRGLPLTVTDALGNHTVNAYDGLGRRIRSARVMCAGTAPCTVNLPYTPDADDIVTQQEWDKAGRLLAQIDDNGNRTSYWFDEADRPLLTRLADGSFHGVGQGGVTWNGSLASPPVFTSWTPGYDRRGNVRLSFDPNGSVVSNTFSAADRLTSRTITLGSGNGYPVVGPDLEQRGTTSETYAYDGLNRLISASDNDTLVTMAYDAMSRITQETVQVASWQGTGWSFTGSATRTVGYTYDAASNVTGISYPGGRTVTITPDDLDRTATITSNQGGGAGNLIASYEYVGGSRVGRRVHGNGTSIEYAWGGHTGGPATPAFRRIVGVENKTGATAFDSRVVGWDAAQNKTSVSHNLPGWSRNYVYDRADRLVGSYEGSGLLASYTLDGVHNRLSVAGTLVSSGSQIGTYVMSGTTPPDDQPVNQYTETPYDLPGYDENGNLVMLRPQGGGGILLDIGLQAAAQDGPMESAINQRLAQGDTYGDLTNDGLVAGDDLTQLTQMMSEGGFGGGEGGGGFGENSGPIRIADLRYDYRNQMVEYANPDTGNVWRFAYDALGRRVLRTTTYGSTTAYVNGGQSSWQVLAEYDGVGTSANLMATYVYGNYIDEPIEMRRDPDGAGAAAMQSFVFHQDDLFNVVALTAGPGGVTVNGLSGPQAFVAGAVVERVRYGDYGFPTYFDAAGTSEIYSSRAGNPYAFTGREWDADLAYYYYRTRYMDPVWGRFTTRDTIGVWGDELNSGSPLAFVASAPWQMVDPLGEAASLVKHPWGLGLLRLTGYNSVDIPALAAAGYPAAVIAAMLGLSVEAVRQTIEANRGEISRQQREHINRLLKKLERLLQEGDAKEAEKTVDDILDDIEEQGGPTKEQAKKFIRDAREKAKGKKKPCTTHDGQSFENRDQQLPDKPAGYKKWHPDNKEGGHRSPQRFVTPNDGEGPSYYYPNHYEGPPIPIPDGLIISL
jgi:RHS repeat-associated protein